MLNLNGALAQQRQQSLYRQRHAITQRGGNKLVINGVRYTNFASNDYLGLATDPRIVKAFKEGADRYGVGSGASQLVAGYSVAHQALEERIADFLKQPRALLFSSGYMANLGVITALLSRNDHIFLDRRSHASLIDAAILSRAKLSRYHTSDISKLTEKLNAAPTMIASDSVFSMDGDIAPLPALATSSKQTQSMLLIDDAHGFGVLGNNGRGCLEHCNIDNNDIDIYVGTLGKACGTSGAFICGSEELIETLIQKSRSLIYTTAPPPAIAHATLTSIDIIEKEGWRRQHINNLMKHFRAGAQQLGLQLTDSATAIQAVIISDNTAAVNASEHLKSRGLYVTAIRPPTVPDNTARLRITLCNYHNETDVEQLLTALKELKLDRLDS
ncbi:MAG: 8-amino-7-oxononanoate synthase [Gammaproteobacteria bacterium]|nr:8-amino-7-oxononanoate synthase [Gammaproteobacteria bacterium]